jgi:predicted ATP-dependent serine protease
MPNQPDKPKTIMKLRCSVCNSEFSVYEKMCPHCFSINTIRVVEEPVIETPLLEKLPSMPQKRHMSFNRFFDDFTPDGIPEGTVVVITGKPGSRKSFASIEWVTNFVRLGIRCLYCSNEMEPYEMDHYIQALGVQSRLPNIIYQKSDITLHKAIMKENYQVVFIDSFQKLRENSGYKRDPTSNDTIIKRINIWAKKYRCILFIISHYNIPACLEHDVRIVFKCTVLKKDNSITRFTTTKNRLINNDKPIDKYFIIGSHGFEEVSL